ncbi:MAG: HPr family phosphocarrier protein [Eubacterium sp.]|nr:HPr family phosphocarrier protein [Eubacterium sp.]
MTEINIKLAAINDVKEFVNIVNLYEHDCDITVGKYVVDAKSIMGLFSLDLSKELKLTVHGGDDEAEAFVGKIKKFVV